ncbi:hypothetical protein [Bradyrhizobium australafricanum]|uniref:hypothetical protein n=1 Tax=Bradyrhizobium australafricanum TaxID=2821406 RepID=UPI001CE39FE3|nr:hypothetical protein [Bradyrhizobium australafricanum]MCA6104935.1 hypothetical protein [Bradyrhizobium australafricanum]
MQPDQSLTAHRVHVVGCDFLGVGEGLLQSVLNGDNVLSTDERHARDDRALSREADSNAGAFLTSVAPSEAVVS